MYQQELSFFEKTFKAMVMSRKFEEKTIELYKKGIILGSLHPGIGHEAASVGVCAALKDDDYIFPHHRGLGCFMYRGTDPKNLLAEWFGKATGICGGKGGVTHAADIERYIMGISGIVGANLPISAGLALSLKMKGSSQVAVCCFGDGGINQGGFHESVNLASLWKLPLIYVCENNMYAFSTPIAESSAVIDLEKRSASYGIEGMAVDGMNIMEVKHAVEKAVEKARKGDGPTFINCKLYRYKGHSMSDKNEYRTKQEEEEWLKKDPIENMKKYLLEKNIMDNAKIERIIREAETEMDMAADFAIESPVPDQKDLMTNVYS